MKNITIASSSSSEAKEDKFCSICKKKGHYAEHHNAMPEIYNDEDSELPTLKGIRCVGCHPLHDYGKEALPHCVTTDGLRGAVIKHIKDLERGLCKSKTGKVIAGCEHCTAINFTIDWIKNFFNITDEDIANAGRE